MNSQKPGRRAEDLDFSSPTRVSNVEVCGSDLREDSGLSSVHYQAQRRPSSWDDSDEDPELPISPADSMKCRSPSNETKSTGKEHLLTDANEIKRELLGTRSAEEVGTSAMSNDDLPIETKQGNEQKSVIGCRQSPARIRRRIKSSNSIPSVFESENEVSWAESINSIAQTKRESLNTNILNLESEDFLDNFFSDLRIKCLQVNCNEPITNDSYQVNKFDELYFERLKQQLRLSTSDTSEAEKVYGSSENYYCRMSRKLSQILEIEEIKKDIEDNDREPEAEGKFKDLKTSESSLFLPHCQYIEGSEDGSSPLPTSRDRTAFSLNQTSEPSKQSEKVQNFDTSLHGSISERCNRLAASECNDISFLRPKSAKIQNCTRLESVWLEHLTFQNYLHGYPINSAINEAPLEENKKDSEGSLKLHARLEELITKKHRNLSESDESVDESAAIMSPEFKLNIDTESANNQEIEDITSSVSCINNENKINEDYNFLSQESLIAESAHKNNVEVNESSSEKSTPTSLRLSEVKSDNSETDDWRKTRDKYKSLIRSFLEDPSEVPSSEREKFGSARPSLGTPKSSSRDSSIISLKTGEPVMNEKSFRSQKSLDSHRRSSWSLEGEEAIVSDRCQASLSSASAGPRVEIAVDGQSKGNDEHEFPEQELILVTSCRKVKKRNLNSRETMETGKTSTANAEGSNSKIDRSRSNKSSKIFLSHSSNEWRPDEELVNDKLMKTGNSSSSDEESTNDVCNQETGVQLYEKINSPEPKDLQSQNCCFAEKLIKKLNTDQMDRSNKSDEIGEDDVIIDDWKSLQKRPSGNDKSRPVSSSSIEKSTVNALETVLQVSLQNETFLRRVRGKTKSRDENEQRGLALQNRSPQEFIKHGQSARSCQNLPQEKDQSMKSYASSDEDLWNDLIEKFDGSDGSSSSPSIARKNFPGIPAENLKNSKECLPSFVRRLPRDHLGLENSEHQESLALKDGPTKKAASSADESDLPNGESSNSVNGQINSSEKHTSKDSSNIYEKTTARLAQITKSNLMIGEFGDVTCYNVGNTELIQSERPKDHGDGNHDILKNWANSTSKPGKKETKTPRLPWTDVNLCELNATTSITNANLPILQEPNLNLLKYLNSLSVRKTKSDNFLSSESRFSEHFQLGAPGKENKNEGDKPEPASKKANKNCGLDEESHRSKSSSSGSLKCSTVDTDESERDWETSERLNRSSASAKAAPDQNCHQDKPESDKKISKDEKDCANLNTLLKNREDEMATTKTNWLIVNGPRKNRKQHKSSKFRSKEKKSEKNLFLRNPPRNILTSDSTSTITLINLENSNCFQNFYKRLISIFCMTSVSSNGTP